MSGYVLSLASDNASNVGKMKNALDDPHGRSQGRESLTCHTTAEYSSIRLAPYNTEVHLQGLNILLKRADGRINVWLLLHESAWTVSLLLVVRLGSKAYLH